MVPLCLELTTPLSLLVQEKTWFRVLYLVRTFFGPLNQLSECHDLRMSKMALCSDAAGDNLLNDVTDCLPLYLKYQDCSQLAPDLVELSMMLLVTLRKLMTRA